MIQHLDGVFGVRQRHRRARPDSPRIFALRLQSCSKMLLGHQWKWESMIRMALSLDRLGFASALGGHADTGFDPLPENGAPLRGETAVLEDIACLLRQLQGAPFAAQNL